MKDHLPKILHSCLLGSLLLVSVTGSAQTTLTKPVPVPALSWQTVVNNGVKVPGDTRTFNSYNQPSINMSGLVVFRARSKGGTSGEPAHGVFLRDMVKGTELTTLFDRTTPLPAPNNLSMTFTEPPSFPRIDMWSDTVVSRGGHAPAWEYQTGIDGETGLPIFTRAGTTGIYTNPFGSLITGEDNLGAVPEFNFFRVPEITTNDIKFDVFPGAPAVADKYTIVFKGNYSVSDSQNPGATVGRTGVYYRTLTNNPIGDAGLEPAGGDAHVILIANNNTFIPGAKVQFGSTAPPSAVDKTAVFAGFDNESKPTKGGIYLAPLNDCMTAPAPSAE